MTSFNIDDDENSNWLHKREVKFSISKDGKVLGQCDISTEKINTNDSELEEFFYLLIDEGIDNGPITEDDGEEFKQYMKRAGYEAKPVPEMRDASTPDIYPEVPELEATLKFQGMTLCIENLAGSVRHGKTHHTRLTAPYGYIKGTEGADGDEVDCFIGADETAPYAFVIHTRNPETNRYDEDKVIFGVQTPREAKQLFEENYDRPGFFESMERMTMRELKRKLVTLRGRKLTA